jgi:uncharacterized membrane protein
MSSRAAITVNRPPDEVERLWRDQGRPRYIDGQDATVSFKAAPGERGTEIHIDLGRDARGGKLGEVVQKVTGAVPLAKAKDELRHFKQIVETGQIVRSESMPEGESATGKFSQRPAQPLEDAETTQAGA